MQKTAPEALGVVYRMPISELKPHPLNPYGIRNDSPMVDLIDSVQKSGVLVPAIARPLPEGGFQLISGHRRKHASELAGLDYMPTIISKLTDDEAIILLVDSNIQREDIASNGKPGLSLPGRLPRNKPKVVPSHLYLL